MAKKPKAQKALELARSQPLPVRLSDPRVQKIGARVSETRKQTYEFLVDRSRDMGELLDEGFALLADRRLYNRWTKSHRLSRTSANNFSNTAKLAREAPATYERWRVLGPAKIYRLARLPPRARDKVLAAPDVAPMTDARFAKLIEPYLEKGRAVTANMVGNGYLQKANGMLGKLDTWQLPDVDDAAMRKRLKARLLDIARRAKSLAASL